MEGRAARRGVEETQPAAPGPCGEQQAEVGRPGRGLCFLSFWILDLGQTAVMRTVNARLYRALTMCQELYSGQTNVVGAIIVPFADEGLEAQRGRLPY